MKNTINIDNKFYEENSVEPQDRACGHLMQFGQKATSLNKEK